MKMTLPWLFFQRRHCRLGQHQGGGHIVLQYLQQCSLFQADQATVVGDRGVVDQHVQFAAAMLDSSVEHRLASARIGHVAGDPVAGRADGCRYFAQAIFAPAADRHTRAMGRKIGRATGADAGAATGDQDRLVL